MKNYILGGIFFVFWLAGCQNTPLEPINDWKRERLKGKVKEIKETIFVSYADLLAKRRGIETTTRFGIDGLAYDLHQILISGKESWGKYRYSGDSVIVKEFTKIDSGKEVWQGDWIYLLDEQKNRKRIIRILVSKEIDYIMDLTANEAGFYTHIKYLDKLRPKLIPCESKMSYDENNFLVEEQLFAYDEKNKTCFDKPIILKIKNDEFGNIRRTKVINREGKLESEFAFLYKYDEQGNWIEKKKYKNEKIQEIFIRKIIYYP